MCPHNARSPQGKCVECGYQVDAVEPQQSPVTLTPSVADPVGSMLSAVPTVSPRQFSTTGYPLTPAARAVVDNTTRIQDDELDNITQTCKHPGIQIHRFPDGETSYHCARCAKSWPDLQNAIDDAEQTQPINMTEGGVEPVVAQLASELSERMAITLSALVDATNPGTAVAIHQYEDFVNAADLSTEGSVQYFGRAFRNNLRANTPFHPLPVQEGGQSGTINMPSIDPALLDANRQLRAATRQAEEAMQASIARRNKAMEDAARAAAAAFDMEQTAEPVNFEGERRLKVVS